MKYQIALIALALTGCGDKCTKLENELANDFIQARESQYSAFVAMAEGYGFRNRGGAHVKDTKENRASGIMAIGPNTGTFLTSQNDDILIGTGINISASHILCFGKNYCRKLGEFVKYDDIRADKEIVTATDNVLTGKPHFGKPIVSGMLAGPKLKSYADNLVGKVHLPPEKTELSEITQGYSNTVVGTPEYIHNVKCERLLYEMSKDGRKLTEADSHRLFTNDCHFILGDGWFKKSKNHD